MTELFSTYINSFHDIYKQENNKFNQTFIAIENISKKKVFLKIYDKRLIDKGPKDLLLLQIEREEKFTQICYSEHIVKLYKRLDTNISIIFIYEFCEYSLLEYIEKNGGLYKNHKFFIKIVCSLAKALKIINDKKIIHRDIKPNNIYIKIIDKNKDEKMIVENSIIKLGDFSSSISIKNNDSIQIGTLFYTAPEIIKNLEYNEKCDMWSLGITLYHLYFGYTPYGDQYDFNLIKNKIYSDNFTFNPSGIHLLDNLFKELLSIEPENRMSHERFYQFAFSNEFIGIQNIPSKIQPNIVDEGIDLEKSEIAQMKIINSVLKLFDVIEAEKNEKKK